MRNQRDFRQLIMRCIILRHQGREARKNDFTIRILNVKLARSGTQIITRAMGSVAACFEKDPPSGHDKYCPHRHYPSSEEMLFGLHLCPLGALTGYLYDISDPICIMAWLWVLGSAEFRASFVLAKRPTHQEIMPQLCDPFFLCSLLPKTMTSERDVHPSLPVFSSCIER